MKRPPRHLVVAATGWLARLATMGLGVLNIRLLTNRLEPSSYVAYVLIANLAPWFALSDFGLGAALQNQLSRARARGSPDGPLLAGAILAIVGATVLAISLGAGVAAPAGKAYLGRFVAAGSTGYFLMAAVLLCGGTLGAFAQRIWYGQQRGHIANIILVVASSVATFGLWRLAKGASLAWALLAGLGPAAAAGMISLGFLAPRGRAAYRAAARGRIPTMLLRDGAGFWALGGMATLVLNLDYLVLSQFLSSRDGVEYSIGARIFELVSVLYGSLLLAYWPAAAEALALGRISEVRRTSRRYALIAVVGVLIAGAGVATTRHFIVRLLAPAAGVELSLWLIFGLTVLTIMRIWTNTVAVVLQALGRTRVLLLVTPAQAVINIALLLLLVPRIGIAGIPIGMALSYLLSAAWVLPVYLRRIERQASGTPILPVPEASVQGE